MRTPILYAEDEPDDAFFLERAFRAENVENPLVVVSNGESAINYLAGRGEFADRVAHPLPRLLLLDLNLPITSGLDVLKWIGTQPSLSHLPVIVITSSTQEGDLHRSRELGARDFMVKPVDPSELIDLVRAIKLQWLTETPCA